jgi:hypothetical protein
MFAKILNAAVSKYPYDLSCLYAENPYTRFDISVDLPTLYSRTEDAANTGASIVEVVSAPAPSCNPAIYKIVEDAAPTLIDGAWVLGSSVVALTQAELDAIAMANEVAQLG